MKTKEALIIFIKNTTLGKVKTRIAKDTGPEKALDIYLKLLSILKENLKPIQQNKILYYSDQIVKDDQWDNEIFKKEVQKGADIGVRMSKAFEQVFKTNDHIILIGSDCPTISGDIIQSAFKQLEENDIVLGPALDGGYYLIGMKKFHPAIFDNISWSTEKVFQQTVKNVLNLNLSLATIPMLSDIDTIKDWEAYLSRNDRMIE